jgi:hypothetical protein
LNVQVYIWSRPLAQQELTLLVNGESSAISSFSSNFPFIPGGGLIALFPLEEGSGNLVFDKLVKWDQV